MQQFFFFQPSKPPVELLEMAVAKGLDKKVLTFLKGKNFNKMTTCRGLTLLHQAAVCGDHLITEYLIESGCDINALDDCGWTPLLLAVQHQYYKTAETLIMAGADIYVLNREGTSVLKLVGRDTYGNNNILCRVIDKMRNENTDDEVKLERLMRSEWSLQSIMKFGHSNLTELALEGGIAVNLRDSNGKTAIHRAIAMGDMYTTISLIKKRADLNICDKEGRAPISSISLIKEHHSILTVLLDKGAKIHELDSTGRMQCIHLFRHGSYWAIKELCRVADFTVKDGYGDTLAHYAACNKDDRVANLICGKNFDLNGINCWAETPLHVAAKMGNSDFFENLLILQADSSLKDYKGNTALFYLKKTICPFEYKHIVEQYLGDTVEELNVESQLLPDTVTFSPYSYTSTLMDVRLQNRGTHAPPRTNTDTDEEKICHSAIKI